MHACMHKFTDMTTVKDMGNGQMQLSQTWLMVGCKCNIHGSLKDETVTDTHADSVPIIKA